MPTLHCAKGHVLQQAPFPASSAKGYRAPPPKASLPIKDDFLGMTQRDFAQNVSFAEKSTGYAVISCAVL